MMKVSQNNMSVSCCLATDNYVTIDKNKGSLFMSKRMTDSYFEVRTLGDAEYAYYIIPPEDNFEENYDPLNEASAQAYARSIGGYVVEVMTRVLH